MSSWMVVEDEPDIYELLLTMFELWGIDGVAFVEGEEACAWIDDVDQGRYKGELPEMAIIDLRLGGVMQGWDVGERLRKSPVLGNIAVVVITGFRFPPEEEASIRRRMQPDRWINKPLPLLNEMQTLLDQTLAEKRAANAASVTAEPSKQQEAAAPEPRTRRSRSRTRSRRRSTSQ